MKKIFPLILSGGSGTRLWPFSRSDRPKQFLHLKGDRSLLQQCIQRFSDSGFERPAFVANERHRFLLSQQIAEMHVDPSLLLLEPVAKNTGPAIVASAIRLRQLFGEVLVVASPADLHISEGAAFRETLDTAVAAADLGYLVLVGVNPTGPSSDFGYIKVGAPIDKCFGVNQVDGFVEKPDRETALGLLDSGQHFWNSGMLVFSVSSLIEETKTIRPDILEVAQAAVDGATDDRLGFELLDSKPFSRAASISIDHAILEKSSKISVTAASFDWSDLGSWGRIWEVDSKDENGNVVHGDVSVVASSGCYVRSDYPFVAVAGVSDLAIVATKDAVLVGSRDDSTLLKQVAVRIAGENRPESVDHVEVMRPWGSYEVLDEGAAFKVKRLRVRSGQQLSLQSHMRRSEHWVVVAGRARVTRGDDRFELSENESIDIPTGVKHRLENQGPGDLVIVEVQVGSYLGEDDIERYDDIYGRSDSS